MNDLFGSTREECQEVEVTSTMTRAYRSYVYLIMAINFLSEHRSCDEMFPVLGQLNTVGKFSLYQCDQCDGDLCKCSSISVFA